MSKSRVALLPVVQLDIPQLSQIHSAADASSFMEMITECATVCKVTAVAIGFESFEQTFPPVFCHIALLGTMTQAEEFEQSVTTAALYMWRLGDHN